MSKQYGIPVDALQPYRYRSPNIPLSAIKRFARRIAEKFHPEKIILFGSYAYGTPHEESDVDLLVIMPTRNVIAQSVRIDLAFERLFSLDLIVRTPSQIKRGLREDDCDWFLREVIEKGKVLYEAPHRPGDPQGRGGHLAGPEFWEGKPMKVEIKGIDCANLTSEEIPTWQPALFQDVYLGFTLSIGPCDEEGSEYFSIVVTTPEALQERKHRTKWKDTTNRKRPIKQQRDSKLLLIHEYNWPEIKETLERMVRECEGLTWQHTVNSLRKRFDWEYEGMAGL